MHTKQISVLLENRKGRLAEVTRLLGEAGINIRALAMADMADLGVLRLIVSDRQACISVLRSHNFVVHEVEVVAAEIEDRPGGLHRIIDVLDQNDINIEYIYTFFQKDSDKAIVVLKISDPRKAVEALMRSGIRVLPDEAIRNL